MREDHLHLWLDKERCRSTHWNVLLPYRRIHQSVYMVCKHPTLIIIHDTPFKEVYPLSAIPGTHCPCNRFCVFRSFQNMRFAWNKWDSLLQVNDYFIKRENSADRQTENDSKLLICREDFQPGFHSKIEGWHVKKKKKSAKVVIWTTLYQIHASMSCLWSSVWRLTLKKKWHSVVFTSGFMELRTKSVLLGSKSGPHMITELSVCTVSVWIVMQLSVIWGPQDAK